MLYFLQGTKNKRVSSNNPTGGYDDIIKENAIFEGYYKVSSSIILSIYHWIKYELKFIGSKNCTWRRVGVFHGTFEGTSANFF